MKRTAQEGLEGRTQAGAPAKKTMRELVKGGDDERCVKTISPTSGFIGEDTYTYIDEDEDGSGMVDDGTGAVRFVNGKLILNRNYHVPTSSVVESYAAPPSKRKAVSLYSRRGEKKQTQKWTTEETEKFFHALRTFGTDFTLMEGVFKGRDRRQIKAKFKKEEKDHPELVDMALRSTIPLNEKKLRDAGISFDDDKEGGAENNTSNDDPDLANSALAAALLSGNIPNKNNENDDENGATEPSKTTGKNAVDEDEAALLRDLFGDDDDDDNGENNDAQ